jgi:uncharacterized protein (DUF2236 family)
MSLTHITDAQLEAWRDEGDPLADRAVTTVLDGGQPVRELLASLQRNAQAVPAGLPAPLNDFLGATAALPAWTDPARLELGERLFSRLGPPSVAVLFCSSLPQCYAAEKGAHVLGFSRRLMSDPERRIVETAQFVLDVMAPGGMGPNGTGVRTTQKVRLMHAALRKLVGADPAWNRAWGTPINQEDLAGTLCSFSTVVLDGLARLGAPLSDDDERAWVHAWRVVGHLLGVREELLPDEPAEVRALFAQICARQHRASEVGHALTRALTEFLDRMTPGTVFDGFGATLIHYLVGDPIAGMVGVPPPTRGGERLLRMFMAVTREVHTMEEHAGLVQRLGEHFARSVLTGLEWVERAGKPVRFEIPTSLREAWAFLPPKS